MATALRTPHSRRDSYSRAIKLYETLAISCYKLDKQVPSLELCQRKKMAMALGTKHVTAQDDTKEFIRGLEMSARKVRPHGSYSIAFTWAG